LRSQHRSWAGRDDVTRALCESELNISTPSTLFATLLKEVAIVLRWANFRRRRQSFWIEADGNTALIDFQRSRSSSAQRISFTINLGVRSARVAAFLSSGPELLDPGIADCHWRQRIGLLLPEGEDKWWTLENVQDLADLRRDLIPILRTTAVPTLLAHLRDSALRDEWLNGHAPGLGEIQRLLYLAVLMRDLGPQDQVGAVMNNLKRSSEGKAAAAMVQYYLPRLGMDE